LIPLLERTIATLPGAPDAPTPWVDRKILFAEEPVRETVRAGHEPRATTSLTFASYDGSDPFEWHRVRTACSILERRLLDRLREDRGATYGVGVGFTHALIGPSRGRVTVRFGSDPAQAESLAEEVLLAVRELVRDGPTVAEVAKEKELQLRELEVGLEQNGFWVSTFSGLSLRDRPLTEVLDRRARIEALDVAGLHRAAKLAWEGKHFTWVDWLPEAGEGADVRPETSAGS
jgi:predicted Zn-dependent peptidase